MEIDQSVRRALNFITVSHVDNVISTALDLSRLQQEEPAAVVPEETKLAVPQGQKKSRKTGIRQ